MDSLETNRDPLNLLDPPPAPPLPPSSPPLPPSSPPLHPPPSPSSLQPQRKRRNTLAEEIHSSEDVLSQEVLTSLEKVVHVWYGFHTVYSGVLHKTNTGTKKLDAIKSTGGYVTSTFYKWKPLAEVKIIDGEIYCSLEESIPNMDDLLKRCQDFLAEHILTATTMRKNGDLLK